MPTPPDPGGLDALRAAREEGRRRGQPHLLRAYVALAVGHLAAGEPDAAESAARVAVQQARAWGDPGELGEALFALGRVLAATERADRALLHLTESVACLERAGREAGPARAALAALGRVPGGAR